MRSESRKACKTQGGEWKTPMAAALFSAVFAAFFHLSHLHDTLFMDRLIAGFCIVFFLFVISKLDKAQKPAENQNSKLYVVYQKKTKNDNKSAR